jgi:hypothetical protein
MAQRFDRLVYASTTVYAGGGDVGVIGQDDEGAFVATSIDVNVDGLDDFKGFVSRELNLNLIPGSDEVLNDHTIGVRFGARNPGSNVVAATKTYFDTLTISTMNLQEYVKTARDFIDLIEAVTTKYRISDLTAAGTADRLDSALRDDKGNLLEQPIDASSTETNRENYRASGYTEVSPT